MPITEYDSTSLRMLADILLPKIGILNNQQYYLPETILFPASLFKKTHNYKSIRNIWYITHYDTIGIKQTFWDIKKGLEYSRLDELGLAIEAARNTLLAQGYDYDIITAISDNYYRTSMRGFSIGEYLTHYIPREYKTLTFLPQKTSIEMAQLDRPTRMHTSLPITIAEHSPLYTKPRILLLDDIATTGHTLATHAKKLQSLYPKSIIDALVFASQ